MPNMRKTNKRQLNLSVTLELWHKLDTFRKRVRMDRVSDVALMFLNQATANIALTAEDYETIAKEMKENERKRQGN